MQLSEAIRLGAMLKPQAYAHFFDSKRGGTCAMGAALDACGRLETEDAFRNGMYESLGEIWPFFHASRDIPCPERCGHTSPSLYWAISHVNDDHHWSRDRTADWIESIEPARSASPEAETADPIPSLSETRG